MICPVCSAEMYYIYEWVCSECERKADEGMPYIVSLLLGDL